MWGSEPSDAMVRRKRESVWKLNRKAVSLHARTTATIMSSLWQLRLACALA